MSGRDRRAERLHAYRDGELAPRAARRAARRLERSPEVRAELERVRAVGDRVREAYAARAGDVPDLWDHIAARLPALDAERAEAEERRARRRPWLLGPLAAGAAAAVLALLWVGLLRPSASPGDVVQWLDTRGAPVMVLDSSDETTVIWLLEPMEDEISGGWGRVAA